MIVYVLPWLIHHQTTIWDNIVYLIVPSILSKSKVLLQERFRLSCFSSQGLVGDKDYNNYYRTGIIKFLIFGDQTRRILGISTFFVHWFGLVSIYDPCNNSDPQFSSGEKVSDLHLGDQQRVTSHEEAG